MNKLTITARSLAFCLFLSACSNETTTETASAATDTVSQTPSVTEIASAGADKMGIDPPVTKTQTLLHSTALFKIGIDRKIKGAKCTQGYILINDEVIAYTLELPDLNNEDYISSIPKGVYSAHIRKDGSLGWRIELEDVPERENVQIHLGNYTSDITGCIVIGKTISLPKCEVYSSSEMMKKLQDKLAKFTRDLILGPGPVKVVEIEVEITGI